MKKSRTEEYTMVHYKTIDQLCCDNCGTVTDSEALHRPEGWITVFRQIEGTHRAWDFDTWSCFIGWATEQDEGAGGYIEDWKRTVEIVKATKEMVKK